MTGPVCVSAKGILFDMDGVLISSIGAAVRCWKRWAKRYCVPNAEEFEIPHGVRWTRQSVRHYDGKVVPGKDPMGRSLFWFTVTPIEEIEEGTDRWAVEQGYVSVTPLRLDLTDEKQLAHASEIRSLAEMSFA